ncbi:MAG: hypothetical protein LBV17_03910 [Treponema sp.]|jgi:hypothetical protein|nr:hypothetical protein [Treponema sp.]
MKKTKLILLALLVMFLGFMVFNCSLGCPGGGNGSNAKKPGSCHWNSNSIGQCKNACITEQHLSDLKTLNPDYKCNCD